jgi:outer membrane protein assembly factor BamB
MHPALATQFAESFPAMPSPGHHSRSCRNAVMSLTLSLSAISHTAAADLPWPNWRGPTATGVSTEAQPAIAWSETKNIAWKVPAPGKGHSSPIIADGRIFLCAAIPVGAAVEPVFDDAPGSHDNVGVDHAYEFSVTALDLATGKTLWRTTVTKTFPHEGGHQTGSLASNSPITDGQHVWAFFGSRGLYCLSCKDGKIAWQKDLGKLTTHHAHGEGASPALRDGTLIVPWDQETGSRVFALDALTGAERWSAARDEITTWATPLVTRATPTSALQVIVPGTTRIRGYDLATGRVLWECRGMSRNVIASPVAADGIVCCGCSYDLKAMLAIKLEGAEGDITAKPNVLWSTNQRTPYVPSPLLYGGNVYFLGHYQGLLSARVAATGERFAGPIRLAGINEVFASPVGAAGRIYITDRNGDTVVITQDADLRQLASNHLADTFSASMALAGKSLILRGEKSVYCIREP